MVEAGNGIALANRAAPPFFACGPYYNHSHFGDITRPVRRSHPAGGCTILVTSADNLKTPGDIASMYNWGLPRGGRPAFSTRAVEARRGKSPVPVQTPKRVNQMRIQGRRGPVIGHASRSDMTASADARYCSGASVATWRKPFSEGRADSTGRNGQRGLPRRSAVSDRRKVSPATNDPPWGIGSDLTRSWK